MGRVLVRSAYLVRQEWAERADVAAQLTRMREAAVVDPVPDIGHRSMLLLVHMAYTALDEPLKQQPARLYWRGRKTMATEGLGYPRARADSAGARSNVSKALRELVTAGVVRSVGDAFPGRTGMYELLLRGDEPSAQPLPAHIDDEAIEALMAQSTGLSTGRLTA